MSQTESSALQHQRPDPDLTRWFVGTTVFAADETTTDEAYADYLTYCPGPALSRSRFLHDLGLLGVHQAAAAEPSLLLRR